MILDSPVKKVYGFGLEKLEELYGERIPAEFVMQMFEHPSADVKGYVLEKKVSYTKQYHDEEHEDEEGFDWEEVDSCWGYYMEEDELIDEVISEYHLKETT